MKYGTQEVTLPAFVCCGHGCKDRGEPVWAELEDKVYHFRNVYWPYVLYHCPKCKRSTMRLPLGRPDVIHPVGLSRTAARKVT